MAIPEDIHHEFAYIIPANAPKPTVVMNTPFHKVSAGSAKNATKPFLKKQKDNYIILLFLSLKLVTTLLGTLIV